MSSSPSPPPCSIAACMCQHRHRPFLRHALAILVHRAAHILPCPSLSARSPSPRPFRVPGSFSPPKTLALLHHGRRPPALSPPRFATASEVNPNLARAPPSPPHPRSVWALTRPPPPPCWAVGERLHLSPPFIVALPRRCSSPPVLLLVSLADSGTTPCVTPLPFFGLASPFRCPSAPWPRPATVQGPWLALTWAGQLLARGPHLSASELAGRGVDLAISTSFLCAVILFIA